MASTKLSAEDKREIVELYQELGQTAATVAEKYGVSVSTISRLLKSELPIAEYESLVRQKRGGSETKSKKLSSRKKLVSKLKKAVAEPRATDDVIYSSREELAESPALVDELGEASEDSASPQRRRTRRSAVERKRPLSRRKVKLSDGDEVDELPLPEVAEPEQLALEVVEIEPKAVDLPSLDLPSLDLPSLGRQKPIKRDRPKLKRTSDDTEQADVTEVEGLEAPESESDYEEPRRRTRRRSRGLAQDEEAAELMSLAAKEEDFPVSEEPDSMDSLALDDLDEGELDGDELDDDSAEDFDDAFDDEDLEDDDDDDSDNITALRRHSHSQEMVRIQPLSEANLSRMLYLVIDRTADLITMPMQHFSDLGRLPEEEEGKKTLPVFENHRVARRFSQRNQRVIKVPDGQMIFKTAPWLEAKGITRCLLDGQVYSLETGED
jgi:transcriptional regulator with XRE-family HTH domain